MINFHGTKSIFHHPVEMNQGLKTYGELSNNDIDVGSNHPHSGVQPGSGNSGPPKPWPSMVFAVRWQATLM